MLQFLKKNDYPIAIDLGSSALKMVQLSEAGGKIALQGAAKAEVPDNLRGNLANRMKWTIDQVKFMLSAKPFKGRKVVSCLPTSELIIQHLRMPKMESRQLEKALAMEAQQKLPSYMTGALLRHIVAGEVYDGDECKQEIIMLAASQGVVQQQLYLIEQSKIEVESINVEANALVNAFGSEENLMLVDLGYQGTKVVVAHGKAVSFCRTIDIAGAKLAQPVATAVATEVEFSLEDSPANVADNYDIMLNKLAAELRSCVQYHDMMFESNCVSRVIFVGGLANDTALCQQLAQQLGLPAQLGDPTGKLLSESRNGKHSDLEATGPNAEWAVAFGLAQL